MGHPHLRNLRAWEDKLFDGRYPDPHLEKDAVTLFITWQVQVDKNYKPVFREAAGGNDPKILHLDVDWVESTLNLAQPMVWKRLWFEKKIAPGEYSGVEARWWIVARNELVPDSNYGSVKVTLLGT